MPTNTSSIAAIRNMYRLFDKAFKKRFKWLVASTFFSSLADLVGLSFLIPVIGLVLTNDFYSRIVQRLPFLSGTTQEKLLIYASAIFFAIIVIKNLFILFVNKLQVRFVNDFYEHSSLQMMDKIYNRSLAEITETPSYILANKLSHLQVALCNATIIPALVVINEAIIIILSIVLVCAWNWQLFLLMAVILIPCLGIFYKGIKERSRKSGAEKNALMVSLNQHAQNMIHGYTDIKIAGTENNFKNAYQQKVKRLSVLQRITDFLVFVPARLIETAIFLCIIIILLYSVLVLEDTTHLVTTIGLFSVIAYRITPSMQRIVLAMNNINATSFIVNDPDFLPTEKTTPTGLPSLQFERQIQFANVSYSYPSQQRSVLQNCSFSIAKGEKLGIIGASGAGKSTLIKLLLGYLKPDSGNITVDGTPIDNTNLSAWWHMLGYVRQDVFIMNTTILENIALGEIKELIDMQRMQYAITAASLDKFVADRPEGLNDVITEMGNNLSGGQKQRIAIARAIYMGAKVLVFDEATSSLDHQTEAEINHTLQQLHNNDITIVIIAHRITSLQHCDRILELKNGSIQASYSYTELSERV